MDLRVAITGHIDHGKSTLIGRLLYDTGSLADGKAEEILASSERRGLAVEWSFAVDAAQEERDQAITIETTRVWMQYGGRRIVIIDTPGHREFIRNMMSGAADADAGILVIDALEGIADQTYRHAYLLRLLDVPEIIVAVNKIDLIDDARERFAQISRDIRAVLETTGKPVRAIVPLSARDGDNVVDRSRRTAWYDGPTLIEVLLDLHPVAPAADRELRFEVSDVYRFNDDERISVGNVVAGVIFPGDRVRIAPSGATTRVRAIKRWPEDPSPALAGQAVGLTFDDPVFIDRGDVLTGADPPAGREFVLRGRVLLAVGKCAARRRDAHAEDRPGRGGGDARRYRRDDRSRHPRQSRARRIGAPFGVRAALAGGAQRRSRSGRALRAAAQLRRGRRR